MIAGIRCEVFGDRSSHCNLQVPIAEKHAIIEEIAAIENQAHLMLKWHIDMKRKWQRAADRPWETVSPDSYPLKLSGN